MQTHAFLRGICRHLLSIRNHTKTHTFREEIGKYLWYFIKFMCFYVVLFALQKRRYLQWFRALEENHTICAFWVSSGCCWAPWAVWVPWAFLVHPGQFLGDPPYDFACVCTVYPFTGDYFACVFTVYPFTGDYFACVCTPILHAYLQCILSLGTILHSDPRTRRNKI